MDFFWKSRRLILHYSSQFFQCRLTIKHLDDSIFLHAEEAHFSGFTIHLIYHPSFYDHSFYVVCNFENFHDSYSSDVSCSVTFVAAYGLQYLSVVGKVHFGIHIQHFFDRFFNLRIFSVIGSSLGCARRTGLSAQSLCYDQIKRWCQHVWFDSHIQKSWDGFDSSVGMQSREHQVPCQCRID